MNLVTLARPYAKAAFACATRHKTMSEWSQMLNASAQATSSSKLAISTLASPRIAAKDKANIVLEALDITDKPFVRFVEELAGHNRLPLLSHIRDLFCELVDESEGIIRVEVASPYPLTEQQQQDIETSLVKRFATRIKMQIIEDASLIGGVIITAKNFTVDASVRYRILKAASAITR